MGSCGIREECGLSEADFVLIRISVLTNLGLKFPCNV